MARSKTMLLKAIADSRDGLGRMERLLNEGDPGPYTSLREVEELASMYRRWLDEDEGELMLRFAAHEEAWT
jgi:hypothetical protein